MKKKKEESNLIFIDLESIKESIKKIETDTLIIIVDLNVYSHYSKLLDLDSLGKKIILWKAPPGENTKNMKEYESCIEFLLKKGIHRHAHLLAIGGGALSDFAGFVAATVLRGISWSIIPTSLLSMIDASIGGKVAINSTSGKNLIGAFHLPTSIYFDSTFLSSLPSEEYQAGLGELIKYAYLDEEIKKLIFNNSKIDPLIQACAKYKKKITLEDFKENGQRKILNLGHTIGHALEYLYPLKHGIAVFWGMAFIYIIFEKEKELQELQLLKSGLSLDATEPPWLNKNLPIEDIMIYISKDKKLTSNESIEVILPKEISEVEVLDISLEELREKIESKAEQVKKFVFS